jgi:L-iditol 2-dehydrogenase
MAPVTDQHAPVARLHGRSDIRVHSEPVPVAGPGTSLVRVTAVGLCGSDLHWYAEGAIGDAKLETPLVLGHEFAGVIEGGPRHGERVAVDPAIPCGQCQACGDGYHNLCPTVAFAGHGQLDGGLRRYLVWPTARLYPLPDALSDADGAMLEPLGIALHALDLGHLRVAGTVAVVGCGPIGLLLVQLARVAGADTVIAVDPLPHRVAAALGYGADHALAPAELTGSTWTELAGRGVDVAFEVAGNDDAVGIALTAARPGARVVLVGIPDGDHTAFPASVARRKGLTLVLSRRMNHVYPRAIRLVDRGRVDVRSVVTHRYPLDRVGEAFETATAREGSKVVVEP